MSENEIVEWWVGQALKDAHATTPKTQEYGGVGGGSADLRIMGGVLQELLGHSDAELGSPWGQELACWLYTLGKVARLVSDYKQGKPGKADTWFDISVYAMMARRIQETGEWP